MPGKQYYLVNVNTSCEEWMPAGDAVLVPHETLGAARKERLETDDTEKIFKHGGGFPGVYIHEILEILDKNGLLDGLIEQCRESRRDLDKEND